MVPFSIILVVEFCGTIYNWIATVCDVPFLMKTYAVNVVLGNWDDYWNNANNYYIYFNSVSTDSYKFFFIPYDYDNCLGTSLQLGGVYDSGTTNPYKWGVDSNPLIHKILEFEDYRSAYTAELRRLTERSSGLFHYDWSVPRILKWQEMITPYLKNDTGSGNSIIDKPAGWGNREFYRLTDESGAKNFFKIRTYYVEKYLED
ncbi:MAG: CotH kinase family protein, partial [Candidatus Cryptobacteroides sp.]